VISHAPDINLTGHPWTYTGAVPSPTLQNGMAAVADGAGHLQATIDAGTADIRMATDFHAGAGSGLGGLAFRLVDANNYLLIETYGGNLQFYRRQNGAYTLLASAPLAPMIAGSTHRLEVHATGSTLRGWWDGVLTLQTVEPFQVSATRHGLDWNSAYDPTTTYDNFVLEDGRPPITRVIVVPNPLTVVAGIRGASARRPSTRPTPSSKASRSPGRLGIPASRAWPAAGWGSRPPSPGFLRDDHAHRNGSQRRQHDDHGHRHEPSGRHERGHPAGIARRLHERLSDGDGAGDRRQQCGHARRLVHVGDGEPGGGHRCECWTGYRAITGVAAGTTTHRDRAQRRERDHHRHRDRPTRTWLVSDTFTGNSDTLLIGHGPDVNRSGQPWTYSGATPFPTLQNGNAAVSAGAGHLQATINTGIADVRLATDYHVGSGPASARSPSVSSTPTIPADRNLCRQSPVLSATERHLHAARECAALDTGAGQYASSRGARVRQHAARLVGWRPDPANRRIVPGRRDPPRPRLEQRLRSTTTTTIFCWRMDGPRSRTSMSCRR